MNILFLEENVHAQRFQLAHRFQQRHRIAGKPGDTFGDHHVDLPGPAVYQQPLEFRAFGFGTGERFIRIHAHIPPSRVLLDHATVIANLRGQRVKHGFLVHRYPRIRRDIEKARR